MKGENGFNAVEFISGIFFLVIVAGIGLSSVKSERIRENFKSYFEMDTSELHETELIKPMVVQRLTELEKTAKEASSVSTSIKSEPPALTPEAVKGKLSRLKDAQKNEHDTWFHWRNACKAAKYYDFVKECVATK